MVEGIPSPTSSRSGGLWAPVVRRVGQFAGDGLVAPSTPTRPVRSASIPSAPAVTPPREATSPASDPRPYYEGWQPWPTSPPVGSRA